MFLETNLHMILEFNDTTLFSLLFYQIILKVGMQNVQMLQEFSVSQQLVEKFHYKVVDFRLHF